LQLAPFSWARQLTDSGFANLLAQYQLLIAGGSALAIEKVRQAESRIFQILAAYHQQHADQLGLGCAR